MSKFAVGALLALAVGADAAETTRWPMVILARALLRDGGIV